MGKDTIVGSLYVFFENLLLLLLLGGVGLAISRFVCGGVGGSLLVHVVSIVVAACGLPPFPADDLELRHWVKMAVPDYRFARFNKRVDMLRYTDEEYVEHLQDPQWTKEDTDLLFGLCQQFDLRFIVIHDRYHQGVLDHNARVQEETKEEKEPPAASRSSTATSASSTSSSGAPARNPRLRGEKTVEDLKARFYKIQQTLLRLRNSTDHIYDVKKHHMFKYAYEQAHEVERKVQLGRLYERTRAEESQMASLVLENRRLSQAIRKLKKQQKDRDRHSRSRGPLTTMPKKGSSSRTPASSAQGSSSSSSSSSSAAAAATPVVPSSGQMAPIPDSCYAKNVLKDRGYGCYLRSTQPRAGLQLGSRQQKQLDAALQELKFDKENPFKVPTEAVCLKFDKLRMDLVTMLNLRKYVEAKEAERDRLRQQLAGTK